MRIPKLKPNDLVEVIWIDAETTASWVSIKEARQYPAATFKTVGYYLKHDKEALYICHSIGTKPDSTCIRSFIPFGCIKKIKHNKSLL